MSKSVVIDLSRLIGRVRHATPSGIDRVEMRYARHFLETQPKSTRIIARLSGLGARCFHPDRVMQFLDYLEAGYANPAGQRPAGAVAKLLASSKRAGELEGATAIVPSHQNWHRAPWLKRLKGQSGKLVLFLHDLIPFQYPEYARAGGGERHEQRLRNALEHADGLIVNSQATRDGLAQYAEAIGRDMPPVLVAPLGTYQCVNSPAHFLPKPAIDGPYFLSIGTIEPRKNHMLLLLLWRRLAEQGHANLPKLVLVGRRGWENEQVIDLLERSGALQDLVVERGDVGDQELSALTAGARAVLMPSFAEGFGMPVNEALAMGTPVIASDLPVYKETAGLVPDYRDPLDGLGWQHLIQSYGEPSSPEREAQLKRLSKWKAPNWEEHFALVEQFIGALQ